MDDQHTACGMAAVTRRDFLKLGAVVAVDSLLLGRMLAAARVLALPLDTQTAPPSPSPSPTPPPNFDGEGRITIEPNDGLVVMRHYTLRVTFVIGPHGMKTGGRFRFIIPPGLPVNDWWSPPQVSEPQRAGFTTVSWQSRLPARVKLEPLARGLHILLAEGELQANDTITLIYGDTRRGSPGARVQRTAATGIAFHVASDVDGNDKFRLLSAAPTITTVPGAPAEIYLAAPSQARSGQPFSVRVAVLDFYKNVVSDFRGAIRLRTSGPRVSAPTAVTLTPADGGIKTFSVTPRETGVLSFDAQASAGLAGAGNPVMVTDSEPPFVLLWGDIHGHTARSDGGGVPEDYYRYARDVVGLDFAALTDHDDMLDDAEWAESKRVTNRFNEPGQFSTLVAYEWTHWVHGHRCVYFKGHEAPIIRRTAPGTDNPAGLWAALRRSGAVVMTIAHHTRGLRGTFDGGQAEIDWRAFPPPADLERLVETYSVHGHCENEELAGPDFKGRKGFVQDALRQGLHLGLMASGDDHSGHPGFGPGAHGEPAGLLGIFAQANTREAIWEALQARRVIGTTGPRIILDFQADGQWMGAEITASAPPRFVAHAWGTAGLARFELLRDATTIYRAALDGTSSAVLEAVDNQPTARTHAYYVRLTQVDGHMAWAGPIWVTRRAPS
jgi:hypothetical protein